MKSILLFLCLFIASANVYTQSTVGVLQSTEEVIPGYIFFSPFSSENAYMIDECGRLINTWERGTNPGLAAYFLENGLMLRTYKPSPIGPFTSASNSGGLELVNWENETVWYYEFNTSEWLSHHDATMMPNGNILVLTWELVYTPELIELGRDPDQIASQGFMWSEKIIEVKPVGTDEIELIWEWEIKDHYIQDFDANKSNFGVVSEHPELFDINLPELNSNNSNSTRDWNHINAIDYNEDLDQILLSVRNSDEIWILDHSTTTEEAKTHEGGIYGKGGDILYRWGNSNAYQRLGEQKLFGQHGVNWIDKGLQDEGKILIFNNGNGRPGPDYSSVEILDPLQTAPGFYEILQNDPIGPENPEWVYDRGNDKFYSPYLSNAQRLENGHTLINAGSPGYMFEINANDEVVWEYVIPLAGNNPVPQGSNPNGNSTFRAYKLSKDHPIFDSLDVSPGSVIEIDSNPFPCLTTSTENILVDHTPFSFTYNSSNAQLGILNPQAKELKLFVFNTVGMVVLEKDISAQEENFELAFNTGIYFIELLDQELKRKSGKIILFE